MANTLVLIKSIRKVSYFGGFTSVPWSSSGGVFKEDKTAFLFILTSPSNTPLKLKVTKATHSVYLCLFSTATMYEEEALEEEAIRLNYSSMRAYYTQELFPQIIYLI